MDLKGKYVVEAGHVSEVYGPVQALRNYLVRNAELFVLISHPFSYTGLEASRIEYYIAGSLAKSKTGHKKSRNVFMQWTRDFFLNIGFLMKADRKVDLFVGIDNLNAFAGIIMKKFGKVDKVAYYIIDHMDRRFKNPLFNFVYETLDKIACRESDTVWALSQRMADAKLKKFGLKGGNFQVVPVGVELGAVDKFTVEEKLAKKSLVLMSMLDETKGVQLLIDAMRDIIKEEPKAQLLIIGTGPYESALKQQAKNLGLEGCVKFLGLMDHASLFRFISHERVGMAPYIDDPNNYSWYADPTKPKEYLACGLPLVITDVPWISDEVGKRPMGVVCKYKKDELAAACVKLLKDDSFYRKCLENSVEYASHLSWDGIYDTAVGKS